MSGAKMPTVKTPYRMFDDLPSTKGGDTGASTRSPTRTKSPLIPPRPALIAPAESPDKKPSAIDVVEEDLTHQQ